MPFLWKVAEGSKRDQKRLKADPKRNQNQDLTNLGCHQEVVQMLLDKDVDVNAQGGYYLGKYNGNALQAALARGCIK